MVREKQIRVVIIDEITDYLDHEDGMGNENSSYPILLKLKKLAKETGCAVLLISNTSDMADVGDEPWVNVYGDLVDSMLILEPDSCEDLDFDRVLIQECNTLAPQGPLLYFRIEPEQGMSLQKDR